MIDELIRDARHVVDTSDENVISTNEGRERSELTDIRCPECHASGSLGVFYQSPTTRRCPSCKHEWGKR